MVGVVWLTYNLVDLPGSVKGLKFGIDKFPASIRTDFGWVLVSLSVLVLDDKHNSLGCILLSAKRKASYVPGV